MRCLRKTDLPPPLRPMTTVIEPVGISRSMPRSTGCRPKRLVNPSTLITGSPRRRLRLARPRSQARLADGCGSQGHAHRLASPTAPARKATPTGPPRRRLRLATPHTQARYHRSEEHTAELPPPTSLGCRLL